MTYGSAIDDNGSKAEVVLERLVCALCPRQYKTHLNGEKCKAQLWLEPIRPEAASIASRLACAKRPDR